jgi:hypothetical protein
MRERGALLIGLASAVVAFGTYALAPTPPLAGPIGYSHCPPKSPDFSSALGGVAPNQIPRNARAKSSP